MHLSPEFGLTYRIIENDGWRIDARVEMLLSSDTAVGAAKSMGLGLIGFADTFERLKPDWIVLVGDRYEILAAAQAALVAAIPVAHACGGDRTEGAFDEAIRHSITKMAHLHFVTNEASARRVRQLGEEPDRIFNVGSLSVDTIRRTALLSRTEVERELQFPFRAKNLLVTFHPVTLLPDGGLEELTELLASLAGLADGFGLIFTMPNADPAGRALAGRIEEFVASREGAQMYSSLGQQLYLSTVAQVDVMVGNSSSALYEAPTLKRAAVNVGCRQRGRLMASSVISCPAEQEAITQAIQTALRLDCSTAVNPYGDGHAAERIVAVLKRRLPRQRLLQKTFVDLTA